ncbi:hypothetical protein R6Q57_029495 [Mikania cordata]
MWIIFVCNPKYRGATCKTALSSSFTFKEHVCGGSCIQLKMVLKFCNQRSLTSAIHLQNFTRLYPVASLLGDSKSSSLFCFRLPLCFKHTLTEGRSEANRRKRRHMIQPKSQLHEPVAISTHEDDVTDEISNATLVWRAIKLPIYSVALVPLTVGTAAAYLQTGLCSAKQYVLLLSSSVLIITWLNLRSRCKQERICC